MNKRQRTNLLLDKLHKGFVLTCLAVTIYGTTVLAFHGYEYFTQVKPQRTQKDRELLLTEGSSDNLKDVATTIKA